VTQATRLKLYWCQTEDHHEDWFVVARRAKDAIRLFSAHEGYDHEDVVAEVATVLPEPLQDEKHLGWPTRELLEACGAEILRWDTPRVVELQGTRWVEGMLEHQILTATDDLFERKGKGRPNRTPRGSTS
jgi:hypothetical protein